MEENKLQKLYELWEDYKEGTGCGCCADVDQYDKEKEIDKIFIELFTKDTNNTSKENNK